VRLLKLLPVDLGHLGHLDELLGVSRLLDCQRLVGHLGARLIQELIVVLI
jgi:hypothetical protein